MKKDVAGNGFCLGCLGALAKHKLPDHQSLMAYGRDGPRHIIGLEGCAKQRFDQSKRRSRLLLRMGLGGNACHTGGMCQPGIKKFTAGKRSGEGRGGQECRVWGSRDH